MQDDRGCLACPLSRCIYDADAQRRGRPVTPSGLLARELVLLGLPTGEIVLLAQITRQQVAHYRRAVNGK